MAAVAMAAVAAWGIPLAPTDPEPRPRTTSGWIGFAFRSGRGFPLAADKSVGSRFLPIVPLLASALLTSGLAPAVAQDDPYAPREDWTGYWGGDLHISVFVFRDLDRDGVYDLGDQPMSGIIIDGSGGGMPIWTTSNGAGFANFTMSGPDRQDSIRTPGRYRLKVEVPSNWRVTTHNTVQTVTFRELPGSPADMVADPVPSLVGLAPDLTISGHLPDAPESQALKGPHGQTLSLSSADSQEFMVEAEPGGWHTVDKPDLGFRMGMAPVQLARQWWDASGSNGAVETVTFDDLQSEGVLKVPTGYRGLGWENVVMTHRKFYPPEGYRNGVVSGEFLAYNGSGHPAAISRQGGFDFVGGYFGVSSLEAEGETLRIAGWRNGKQVYAETLSLSAIGPLYLAAEFDDIDRLTFSTDHYWQFTADDLDFRIPPQGAR